VFDGGRGAEAGSLGLGGDEDAVQSGELAVRAPRGVLGSTAARRALRFSASLTWLFEGPGYLYVALTVDALNDAPSNTVPVCRFYGVPVNGPTSHYFTASASECAALKTDPKWVYEGIAFRALPLVNGACPSGMVTVTRVSKTGTTPAATRYRWVVDPNRVATMATFEGWTVDGPALCAMPAT